jgi:hypothetical protein
MEIAPLVNSLDKPRQSPPSSPDSHLSSATSSSNSSMEHPHHGSHIGLASASRRSIGGCEPGSKARSMHMDSVDSSSGMECRTIRNSRRRPLLTPLDRMGNKKEWLQVESASESRNQKSGKGILKKKSSSDEAVFVGSSQNSIEFWMNIMVFFFFIGGMCYVLLSPDSLRVD